jgi:hypothetical protein
MEPTKFNLLVDKLLEPKLKSHIRARMTYPYVSSDNPHESSVALRPKARDCDECGLNVIGRVIFIEKRGLGSRNERWQKKCGECGKKTPLHNGLKDL